MTRAQVEAAGRPVYWLGTCSVCGTVSRGLYDVEGELRARGLGDVARLVDRGAEACASCTAAALAGARCRALPDGVVVVRA